MTIVLSEDGIHYRWRQLRWDEVGSARVQTHFGRPYLRVAGAEPARPALSLPLYFVGPRPLLVALRDHAPPGNPIRACLGDTIR